MTKLLTIVAGAALFLWPALLNGYPIVFSDTQGYLDEGIGMAVPWNHPFTYALLIKPLHEQISLWPIIVVQALLLSIMLWLTQRTLLPHPRRTFHLALCLILAVASAAPWFTSLVIPDDLTPICVLGLFLLAFAPGKLGRKTLAAVALVTVVATGAHLSNLLLAAACVTALAVLRWQTAWRPAAALAAAVAMLVTINGIGLGAPGVSPYGSPFALARLIGDGPAVRYIDKVCPEAGYYLCRWKGHTFKDSDAFLWAPNAPMSVDSYGAVRFAPEAAELVRNTILAYPGQVLAAATRNALTQLTMVELGDTLTPDYLDLTVRDTLATDFSPAEAARFNAGLQARGKLRPIAERFNLLDQSLLILGTLGTIAVATTRWRRNRRLSAFATLTLVALLANAVATGALSGPHDRYQARIAWLILLPALAALPQATFRNAIAP